MFIAKLQNGDEISLTMKIPKEKWVHIRETERFYCPCCNQQVQLKLGEHRLWHFSHVKGSVCEAQSEKETEYHLLGKAMLYKWLLTQYNHVQLEPYMKEIKQRPDILFSHYGKRFVIEYQCSTIDDTSFRKRTLSYLKSGVTPIWILGGKRYKKLSEYSLQITAFDWSTASTVFSHYFLLYFCPQSKQFLIVTNPIPFSPKVTFAPQHMLPLSKVTLKELIQRKATPNVNALHPFWCAKKKQWRTNATLFIQHQYKSLQQLFYQKNMPLSLVPAEAGIPLRSLLFIHTPSIIWQGWILIEHIIPVPIGDTITFQQIYQSFKEKINRRIFQTRTLPLLATQHYSYSLREYLNALVELGVLAKREREVFIKIRDVKIPRTIDEAILLDFQVIQKLNQTFV